MQSEIFCNKYIPKVNTVLVQYARLRICAERTVQCTVLYCFVGVCTRIILCVCCVESLRGPVHYSSRLLDSYECAPVIDGPEGSALSADSE